MKRIIYIIISLMPILWFGCKEEDRIFHFDDNAPAPAQVTDVIVYNTPGGAVLKYKLPTGSNLLSVKAVYEIQPGVQCETESSYYKDSLVLEGFGDTKTYDVKLYSIGKNEKASEPLTVRVNPTTAPVNLAIKELSEAFGGVTIKIENPMKANLSAILMGDTAHLGFQSILQTYYTSAEKVNFSFRGLDTVPGDFSVYLRDRWNNISETTSATLTPLFEEEINKDTWRDFDLPGDTPPLIPALRVSGIWDGGFTDPNTSAYFSENLPLPQTITWDLGQTVIMSRLKMWPRNHNDDRWRRGHARIFELWGSLAPNMDGSMDATWIPMGRFECVKPSPGETITQEDINFAFAGIDFDFEISDFAPNPFVPVRYIRLRTIATYSYAPVTNVSYQEISFWGTITK